MGKRGFYFEFKRVTGFSLRMLLLPLFLLILSLNLLEGRRYLTHSLLNLAVTKDTSWLIQPESKFDPYADNGGTVIGIAGRDFCIIASDTRLSHSYVIKSRNISRIFTVINSIISTPIDSHRILDQRSLRYYS